MRLEKRLEAMNQYGKKMFRRVKEAMMKKKKTEKKKKKETMFQYDPWSYALNFDEGGGDNLRRFCCDSKRCTITLIYVVAVKF